MLKMLGSRRFIEIPGERAYELPPLMLKQVESPNELQEMVGAAEGIVEGDALIPDKLRDLPDAEAVLSHHRFGLCALAQLQSTRRQGID